MIQLSCLLPRWSVGKLVGDLKTEGVYEGVLLLARLSVLLDLLSFRLCPFVPLLVSLFVSLFVPLLVALFVSLNGLLVELLLLKDFFFLTFLEEDESLLKSLWVLLLWRLLWWLLLWRLEFLLPMLLQCFFTLIQPVVFKDVFDLLS